MTAQMPTAAPPPHDPVANQSGLAPAQSSTKTRIVGIGASAGGLSALEEFFAQTPSHSGLAYIVVQHLDPTQKALLAELLQRVTTMRVRQAEAMQRVEADCVYVIPPNTELSVVDGQLQLDAPAEPRGMRLPINILFSSLARDQRELAIAIVLSGMGSDGTLGLRAVKASGGLTLVQQPDSAQFDAMPKSAIAAGCADIVAPPAAMPARILAYTARQPNSVVSEIPASTLSAATAQRKEATSNTGLAPGDHLQNIFELLQQRTRHDFSRYKSSTLYRRIERRMAIHGYATIAAYAEFLQHNPQEIDLLFKELLIGVTSFFRDGPVWQQLAETTLPELLARRAQEPKLRAWVVGCSTGEEAYSLAIVFAETVQRLPQFRNHTLQIFASDLNPDAIAAARRGQYPTTISADVSATRLAAFFTVHDGYYLINKTLRDTVLFAEQDIVLDPPFTKIDLLSCRNLMIYFDATLQRRLLPLFHYSLRPGGVLLLGSSETVGQFSRLFTPIEMKLRLYARQDDTPGTSPNFLMQSFSSPPSTYKELPMPPPTAPSETAENLQKAADHVLLQVHAPPAVVVNSSGDIVYISGRTGKYLEPAAGKANWNFHAMVRDGLRGPIANALKEAATSNTPLQLRGLHVQVPGGVQNVDVTVQALRDPGALQDMTMIVFRDMPTTPAGRRRKTLSAQEASHELELQQCRDEIYALREAARASREELQSANEELQSTNEELQSTNEELTTSKEEMQSMNEELQTINAEMQTRLDDLALAQSDLKNLLNSTDIAILFLDQELNVRRYTDRASKVINLRESDIGRPLSDLTTTLE
ncbi:MAG: chemotaxis protein CheB, partial [Spongiibacteraceae bacterium]